jgi:hypothetical protein
MFTIDGLECSYEAMGETLWGPDEVMLDEDDDLASGLSWSDRGYCVTRFLDPADNELLREGFRQNVRRMLAEAGAQTEGSFALEDYHRVVDHERHRAVVRQIQARMPPDWFPVPIERVEDRLSSICDVRLRVFRNNLGNPAFWLRIVRPGQRDYNPLHRDVWLDRLRNKINIYFPLAGSDARSSLCMVPGSHRWKESELQRTGQGATIDGVSFTVPAVVGAKREIAATRPNPGPEEVLVFSPYLVHGNATNSNPDATRVSLEIRFERVPTGDPEPSTGGPDR